MKDIVLKDETIDLNSVSVENLKSMLDKISSEELSLEQEIDDILQQLM